MNQQDGDLVYDYPAVEAVLTRHEGKGRAGLLPCLQDLQQINGWLTPELCQLVGQRLNIPIADIYGVIDYYALLYKEPVGRTIIRVCDDIACYLAGSEEVLAEFKKWLGIGPGETTPDGKYTLEVHPCLGYCDQAPMALVNQEIHGHLTPEAVATLLEAK